MEQPLKYSDLIQADESIENLIGQLKEVNAQYTELGNSVKQEAARISSAMKTVSGATEEGRKKIKDSSKETDRLAKEYKKLEQAMDANAKEIARLGIARRQMTNYQKLMVQRGSQEIKTIEQIKNASYQQLSAQYALNKAYINGLTPKERAIAKNKELVDSTRRIYEQMKVLQVETGKHQLNVGNYAGSIAGLTKGFASAAIGIGSLAAAGTMAVGALKEGVSTAMNFEAAVSKLSAILGVSTDDMKELIEQARQLGATTVFTAQEVAELQTELAKLGYSKPEIVDMTQSVLYFAQATGASLADASSLTGAALRMFEKGTEETADFVDKMAASTNKSALSFSFLQNAMSTVSPVANAFGFQVEEVLALLGQLANAGFDASSAATATRNILLNIADSNGALAKSLGTPVKNLDDLIKGLTTLNNAGVDLATSLELTDKRSVAAFQTFLKGTDNVLALRDALNAADGTAEKMAQTMGDNLSGDVKSLGSAWEDFMIEINNGQSILRTAVQGVTGVVRSMASLWKRMRDYFQSMYDESAAFRYIVEGIGLQFKNTGEVITLVLKNTWSQLKAVGHLVKGIFTLDMDEIKTAWKLGVSDVLDNIGKSAINVRDNIQKVVSVTIHGQKRIAQEQKKAQKEGTASVTGTPTATGGGKIVTKKDKKEAQERQKAEKEAMKLAKRKLEIQRAYDDAFIELIENEGDRERAKLVTRYNRQIEDLRIKLETEKKLTIEERENINNTIYALQEQQGNALADLVEKQALEELDAQKKVLDMQNSGMTPSLDAQIKNLEKQKELEIQRNRLVTKNRVDEQLIIDKYEKQKEKLIYDSSMKQYDMEAELRQMEIDNLQTSEYEKTQLRIQAEKDRIQKIYDLNVKAGKDINSLEMQMLREQMNTLDIEMKKTDKTADMWDRMGFKLDDEQKDAISESFNFAIEQLQGYMQTWVDAANQKVEAANKDVENAQKVLDAEREARANGYASNVEFAQKELDLAKKNQEKALKEQERAKKAQILLDTAVQASSLITATANIWKSFTPLGPWGIAGAVAATALMWGSFAASRIKAMQATSQGSEEYGEGTVELLDGGSHQSGNDVDLGRKKDGTRRRAEGGEFFAVINKRNSRKYRDEIPDVIKAFNNGTFEQKYGNAYAGAQGVFLTDGQQSPDLRDLSSDVSAIREQGEKRTYTDSKGTHVVYKNLHRIIKN